MRAHAALRGSRIIHPSTRTATMRTRLFIPLFAAAALAACDSGTGAEAGGEYIAALESPYGAEGGAILEMTDTGVESVDAGSLSLFQQPVSGGRRLILVREPAGRLEFRVRLTPGSAMPEIRVLEVVDGDDQPRPTMDGYTVSFTRTRGDQ